MKPILKLIKADEKQKQVGFEQIDEETLRLKFGKVSIELRASGEICFHNHTSLIELSNDAVSIQNSKSKMHLKEDGEIVIDGVVVRQKSKTHIHVDAKQNIYLNSQ